jgi:hypothetical protein
MFLWCTFNVCSIINFLHANYWVPMLKFYMWIARCSYIWDNKMCRILWLKYLDKYRWAIIPQSTEFSGYPTKFRLISGQQMSWLVRQGLLFQHIWSKVSLLVAYFLGVFIIKFLCNKDMKPWKRKDVFLNVYIFLSLYLYIVLINSCCR